MGSITQRLLDITSGYILIHGGASPLTVVQGINKIYPVPQWQRIIEDIQMKQPEQISIVLLCGRDDVRWTAEVLNVALMLR